MYFLEKLMNMEIQELRIGNWVLYDGVVNKVTSIDRDMNFNGYYRVFISNADGETNSVAVELLEPVLITVDILNNNFESLVNKYYPNVDNRRYYIDISHNFVFIGNDEEGGINFNHPFMAVHQLQNLWRDIVHEELRITF